MTIISNSFATACIYLPKKYTISTLYSANIADNQDSYGYIWKFTRFPFVKKERQVNAFHYVCTPPLKPRPGFCIAICDSKVNKFFS